MCKVQKLIELNFITFLNVIRIELMHFWQVKTGCLSVTNRVEPRTLEKQKNCRWRHMMERFKLRAHLDKMSAKEKNVKKCWPKKLLHQTDTQVFLVQTKMMIMLTFAVVWALHIFFCKFDWQKNHGDNFDFIVKCPVIFLVR